MYVLTAGLDKVLAPASALVRFRAEMRLALPIIAVLAACGPNERDPVVSDAGLDSTPSHDVAPQECYGGTTDVDVALQIQIQQSCAIWNSLAELDGRAKVTRAGTNLSIDFANGVVFSGTVIGGVVKLVYAHQHPFSDGCGWKATETMDGQLDSSNCNLKLEYDYVESVVTSDGSCASPCSAQANVNLELKPVIL